MIRKLTRDLLRLRFSMIGMRHPTTGQAIDSAEAFDRVLKETSELTLGGTPECTVAVICMHYQKGKMEARLSDLQILKKIQSERFPKEPLPVVSDLASFIAYLIRLEGPSICTEEAMPDEVIRAEALFATAFFKDLFV